MQDALDLLRNSTRITAAIFRCAFGLEGKEYGGEGVATEPFSSLFKPSNIMFINIKILKMKQKAKAFLCLSPCTLKTHGNVWSLSLLNFCYELKNCLLKTTICINFSCSWELSKKWISHTYHPINLFYFFTAKYVLFCSWTWLTLLRAVWCFLALVFMTRCWEVLWLQLLTPTVSSEASVFAHKDHTSRRLIPTSGMNKHL